MHRCDCHANSAIAVCREEHGSRLSHRVFGPNNNVSLSLQHPLHNILYDMILSLKLYVFLYINLCYLFHLCRESTPIPATPVPATPSTPFTQTPWAQDNNLTPYNQPQQIQQLVQAKQQIDRPATVFDKPAVSIYLTDLEVIIAKR